MNNNVMIDLETMGKGSDAAIVSIGAVRFYEGGITETFYQSVSLESSVKVGLKMDASTVEWWMRQSDQARKEIEGGKELHIALQSLAVFLGENAILWGNGSDFDNAILANAYRAIGQQQPWKFWNNRCYRTVKNLCGSVPMQRKGVHHSALNDAESQALHLIEIANRLGLKL